jgi:hypothetical protein
MLFQTPLSIINCQTIFKRVARRSFGPIKPKSLRNGASGLPSAKISLVAPTGSGKTVIAA